MKFIHIADIHLGATPDIGFRQEGKKKSKELRGKEIWETFEYVLNECERDQTDLLLIAGDLFHAQPLVRELKEVDYLFSQLTHTKVVLIAGNHDYLRKDSNYLTFEWSENVYPLFESEPRYIDFPELDTAVYGLSYDRREIREPLYDNLRAAGVRKNEILLAHGGDETHIPINKNQLYRAGFSYVAMGHIHKPMVLEKNRIIYPGALEPMDSNDVGPHGFIKGELYNGETKVQWIPAAIRNYIHAKMEVTPSDTQGSVRKKIEQFISENGNENIYKFFLCGKRSENMEFYVDRLAELEGVVEVTDQTRPAYDFQKLYEENKETLLGKYIAKFAGCEEGSMEYMALCEGVEALKKEAKNL